MTLRPYHYAALPIFLIIGCTASDKITLADTDSIHSNAIVIDTHSDFLDRSEIDGSSLNEDVPGAQTTVRKLRDGEVDAQFFSIFVPPAFEEYGFRKRTDELIDRLEAEVAANSGSIEIVSDTDGINRLANSGKTAALLGIEGGHSIENDLNALKHFYDRGVRYMTLTWTNTNGWADASGDDARWNGLNDLGRNVVREMNKLGMMVDISHISDETFWDVMEITRLPVMASHSSVRGEMDHPRNMSDEMILAVAENGGVIQINFYAQYLDQKFHDEFKAAKEENSDRLEEIAEKYADDLVEQDIQLWDAEKKIELTLTPPDASRVVDHIEYVIKLAGVDYVGLGSDYDGMGAPPKGLEHIGKIKYVTEELSRRGYSAGDIEKVLGGNLLRVMAANENGRG